MSELAEKLDALIAGATGGPWFVHDFRGASEHPDVHDITVSCDHPATITVCSMDRALTATPEEALGNANLIARAPLLAAVARDAVEIREAFNETRVNQTRDAWYRHRMAEHALAASLAALAKEIDNGTDATRLNRRNPPMSDEPADHEKALEVLRQGLERSPPELRGHNWKCGAALVELFAADVELEATVARLSKAREHRKVTRMSAEFERAKERRKSAIVAIVKEVGNG